MKFLRWFLGILTLGLFFLFVDDSGIGMKENWSAVKKFSHAREKLHFRPAGWHAKE